MPINLSDRLVASATVLSTQMDEELVLMDVQTGNYFSLEEVSLEIWRALAEPMTVSDLCDRLIARYDAPEPRIRASVLKFLEKCKEHDLIRVA